MSEIRDNEFRCFCDLVMQSSPECLHSDGEASPEEVNDRLCHIENEWSRLEVIVGRKVTEDEIFKRLMADGDHEV